MLKQLQKLKTPKTTNKSSYGISIFLNKISAENFTVLIVMLIGILARGIMLGSVPGGVNADEAYAGYEAYSLLHYGTDSYGYSFPVYLITWGSGMSALNTYMMIPFVALFGMHEWVIRIPEFLVSCCTLPVIYSLFNKIFNKKAAFIALLYLAICPWSIMSSRWALDCNLAPGFLLFGLYFFLKGVQNSRYYILSALFYGLSLYCYATIWLIVPFIIGFQILYLWWTKKTHIDRCCIFSVVLLGLLALPLILFYLINTGHMEEIRTAYFSIPKLIAMRDNEITIAQWYQKLRLMIYTIVKQYDGYYWNSTQEYGLYYKWALPFAGVGLVYCVVKSLISIFRRSYMPEVMLMFQFGFSVILGCLIEVNINRINSIHIPIICFIVTGIYLVIDFTGRYAKYIQGAAAVLMTVCFVCFMTFYFTEYRDNIGKEFGDGLGQAIECAEALAADVDNGGSTVHIDSFIKHSKVLFYRHTPVDVYMDTVTYTNYPDPYLSVSAFADYVFEEPDTSEDCIYILSESNISTFEQAGWTVERYGHTAVAYKL